MRGTTHRLAVPGRHTRAEVGQHRRRIIGERVEQVGDELWIAAGGLHQTFERLPVDRRRRTGRRPFERIGEFGRPDRFGDVVVHPGVQASLAIVLHRVGGQRDDARPRRAVTLDDGSCRLQAVHFWHLHVHQDDVVHRFADRGYRLRAVVRDVGGVAHSLEQLQHELLVDGVVLGEQDPQRVPFREVGWHIDTPLRGSGLRRRGSADQFGERGVQGGGFERLDQVAGEPGVSVPRVAANLMSHRREEQQRQRLGRSLARTDLGGELEAVHHRHHQVEHSHIERPVALERREGIAHPSWPR